MIELNKILALLKYPVSSLFLEEIVGVSDTDFLELQKNPDLIMQFSLEKAIKLQRYYENNFEINCVSELERLAEEPMLSLKVSIFDSKEALLAAKAKLEEITQDELKNIASKIESFNNTAKIYEIHKYDKELAFFDNAEEACDYI